MSSENALLPRVWELERSLATAVRVNESLRQQLAAKQAEIDSLMLEYCPNEMTPEQLEEWGLNQVPAKEQGK